jgi:PPP family 3-phenylpropionic acid transporter
MPYWRLSGFYFFYFATLGVLVPYWSLYLQSVGFTPVDIWLPVELPLVKYVEVSVGGEAPHLWLIRC